MNPSPMSRERLNEKQGRERMDDLDCLLVRLGGERNRKHKKRPPLPRGGLVAPALLGVEARENEEVRWHWTHFSDGRSMVTGYTITTRLRP